MKKAIGLGVATVMLSPLLLVGMVTVAVGGEAADACGIDGDFSVVDFDEACMEGDVMFSDDGKSVGNIGKARTRANAIVAAWKARRPDPYKRKLNWYRRCGELAAVVHGRSASGHATALAQWRQYVKTGKAHKSGSPPAGALLFYSTGHPSGHVAVYLGDGKVISNDVWDKKTGRHGGVYIVPAKELTKGAWRLKYLGWAPPIF